MNSRIIVDHEQTFYMIQMYAPSKGAEEEKIVEVYEELQKLNRRKQNNYSRQLDW